MSNSVRTVRGFALPGPSIVPITLTRAIVKILCAQIQVGRIDDHFDHPSIAVVAGLRDAATRLGHLRHAAMAVVLVLRYELQVIVRRSTVRDNTRFAAS